MFRRFGFGIVLLALLLALPGTAGCASRAPESNGTRLLQGILAVGIVAVLGWSAVQPYLFVTSIFPVAAVWGAGVLLALALVLLVSALLPHWAEEKSVGTTHTG